MSIAQYGYEIKVAAIHRFRVNLKSLVAESKAIRIEEQRCGPVYRHELYMHRVRELRTEIRHAQLAYAYVRGRGYRQVEQTTRKDTRPIDIGRLVAKIVKMMGLNDGQREGLRNELTKWIAAPYAVS